MRKRPRRRIRTRLYRAIRLARKHSVTMVSACVLGVAAYLAMTHGAFTDPDDAASESTSAADAPPAAQAVAAPSAASIRLAPRPRRQAIVYVVTTDAEGTEVLATHNRLIWDIVTGDSPPTLPDIHYVVAGTPEQQAQAIQTLNNYLEVASLLRIDLRIVDLRPGRGVAANSASP